MTPSSRRFAVPVHLRLPAHRARRLLSTSLLLALVIAVAVPATASAMRVGIQSDNLTRAYLPSDRESGFQREHELGATIVRTELSWNEVADNCGHTYDTNRAALANPDNGCYNWSRYDDLVQVAARNKETLLWSVYEAPHWANNHPNTFNVGASKAQFNKVVTAYALFLSAAGKRYKAGSPHGFVKYWTIWNEPNSRTFWAPFNSHSPQRFALMYTKSAKALKAANKRAKVAPGPTGPNSTGMKPVKYIRAMQPWLVKYKSRRFIDAWAHNPYPAVGRSPHAVAFRSPSIGIGNFADLTRTLDRSSATRGKKIWATEFAYQTRPQDHTGVSSVNQATYLAQCYAILQQSKRVDIALWYVLQDPTNPIDWQSGVQYANGKHKPSWAMFQRMVATSSARVRRGTRVTVWGRSNLAAHSGSLVWSKSGHRGWRRIPGQHRRRDGSMTASPKFSRSMFVAVRDAKGMGPSRKVTAR